MSAPLSIAQLAALRLLADGRHHITPCSRGYWRGDQFVYRTTVRALLRLGFLEWRGSGALGGGVVATPRGRAIGKTQLGRSA
jgi:hypothetical protein